MVDAAGPEAALGDLESAALAEKDAVDRHTDVVERDLHAIRESNARMRGTARPRVVIGTHSPSIRSILRRVRILVPPTPRGDVIPAWRVAV